LRCRGAAPRLLLAPVVGLVSGHTLKHLLAAAASLWLLRAAARRDQLR